MSLGKCKLKQQLGTTIYPFRIVEIRNSDTTKSWWGCTPTGTLIHHWWECKLAWPLCKTVWEFLTKLNIFLLYDSAIVLLDMYPETYAHTKTSFIQNCQSLETTTVPFNRRMNKLWETQTIRVILHYTEISCQTAKRHGRDLNAYYKVKEANTKRQHTVCFQLFEILKKAKLWKQ